MLFILIEKMTERKRDFALFKLQSLFKGFKLNPLPKIEKKIDICEGPFEIKVILKNNFQIKNFNFCLHYRIFQLA